MLLPILPLIFDYSDNPFELIKSSKGIMKYSKKYGITLKDLTTTYIVDEHGHAPVQKYYAYQNNRYIYNNTVTKFNKKILQHYKFKKLLLGGFDGILTDNDLKNMSNVDTLYINNASFITDNGLKYVQKVKDVHLYNATLITNNGLQYLSNAHTVLITNSNITDDGLQYLSNAHTIIMSRSSITNDGLKHIPNVRFLSVVDNQSITNDGIKYIPNIESLYLDNNRHVTDECLKLIPHVERIKSMTFDLTLDKKTKIFKSLRY